MSSSTEAGDHVACKTRASESKRAVKREVSFESDEWVVKRSGGRSWVPKQEERPINVQNGNAFCRFK
jgi:hypothetical protein